MRKDGTERIRTDFENTVQEAESVKGLYVALSEYGASDYYPYHMPGHKRNMQAGEMGRYYGIDITEIDGFDNLHQPEGILLEAQKRANRLYGADETFYLVGGSTCGILASIMAAVRRGSELLVARNCHKSVYHAAILQELRIRYYHPPLLKEYGIYDGVAAEGINDMLIQYPDCEAVVITSPTYEGIVSDIRAVADVVHKQNKILIVDEAHGAHFGLSKDMPEGAIGGGVDLVIHSLHKTLPAMTQTALLHVQGNRVDRKRLRRFLGMLQTSSPSYVMMASIDSCIRYVELHGDERFAYMRRQYDIFCEKIEKCKHIRIGKITNESGKFHLTGWDIGKLVILVQDLFMNGQKLYDVLRDEYHLQMEMAADHYVLAIMTIMDTEEGWQRLADALVQIDDRIERENMQMCGFWPVGVLQTSVCKNGWESSQQRNNIREESMQAEIRRKPSDAFYAQCEEVPLSETVGRVMGDFVNLYPPGVPLLVPGEVMNESILARIEESIHMGFHVQGVTSEGKVSVLLD